MLSNANHMVVVPHRKALLIVTSDYTHRHTSLSKLDGLGNLPGLFLPCSLQLTADCFGTLIITWCFL